MLTLCLLATLIIFAVIFACTVGAAGAVVFVLFGDVILLVAIVATIRKIHTYFKNKKNLKRQLMYIHNQ